MLQQKIKLALVLNFNSTAFN